MCVAWGGSDVLADDAPVLQRLTGGSASLAPAFTVFVVNDPALRDGVTAMLTEQRAASSKYGRASTSGAIVRYDKQFIEAYLRSQGYYMPRIESRLQRGQVAYQLFPGSRYVIGRLVLDWPKELPEPPEQIVTPKSGAPLAAQAVLDGQAGIKQWVLDNLCLRDVAVSYSATVNHSEKTATLIYRLASSPEVVFGGVTYTGNDTIDTEFLDHFIEYSPGDCFKQALLDSTRLKLLQSNLLANVEPQPQAITAGKVPVNFRLVERKQRSMGIGVGYDADIKAKLSGSWQHRNLWGGGEQLTTEVIFSEISKSLGGDIIVPFFYHEDQRLTLTGLLEDERTEAYDVYKGSAGANVKREVTDKFSANVGANFSLSRVQQFTSDDDFALFSLPMSTDLSTQNNPLDPENGWTAGIQFEPFIDLFKTGRRFTQTTFAASAYASARDYPLRPVLAMRFAVGVMGGAEREEVPRDHFFYVGGGGSLRGYSYQSVGAFADDGTPAGGLSFSETSIELRTRVGNNIGITFFADGGYAYQGRKPAVGEKYLWGAGLGLRYHTSFAPFRIDIATPLNPREDATGEQIDDDIQVYVGIGQSF